MVRWQAAVACIVIVSFLFTGCYTTKYRPIDENPPTKTMRVDGVVLKTGDTVTFRNHDGTFDPKTGSIVGIAGDGTHRVFNTDDVSSLMLRKKEPISWIIAGVLVAGALTAIIIYAIHEAIDSSWDDSWDVVN